MNNKKALFVWILRIAVAALFVFAALPKLTGQPEPVQVFQSLGAEPYGRYLTGVLELVAAIIFLVPGKGVFGSLLGILLMAGALGAHAWKLGFAGSAGEMAAMAAGILLACIVILVLRPARQD
ncbi:MAG: DoxX-like family protein [Verrucomicrobia bacterium]|nr:MAG: DoxX-like family protein [Verrucomicrobiota bacterium]